MAHLATKPKQCSGPLRVVSGRAAGYTAAGVRVDYRLSDGSTKTGDLVLGRFVWVRGRTATLETIPVPGRKTMPEVRYVTGGLASVPWHEVHPWAGWPYDDDVPF